MRNKKTNKDTKNEEENVEEEIDKLFFELKQNKEKEGQNEKK